MMPNAIAAFECQKSTSRVAAIHNAKETGTKQAAIPKFRSRLKIGFNGSNRKCARADLAGISVSCAEGRSKQAAKRPCPTRSPIAKPMPKSAPRRLVRTSTRAHVTYMVAGALQTTWRRASLQGSVSANENARATATEVCSRGHSLLLRCPSSLQPPSCPFHPSPWQVARRLSPRHRHPSRRPHHRPRRPRHHRPACPQGWPRQCRIGQRMG